MDSATFVTQLRDLGLWPEEPAQQEAVLQRSRQLPDARALAGELIKQHLLTPYQANQLLTGKGQALAVGPYRILERLGAGGMGQVFKARHHRYHRLVALKVLHPERVANPVAVGRFLREVQAAAQLSHRNVVRAYDADHDGTAYYLAMQFIAGTDLGHLLKKTGPLPVAEACDYLRQAALGLQHIHENGLVHRDIKPSNLFITGPADTVTPEEAAAASATVTPGIVKILDLGVARLIDVPVGGGPEALALTHPGSVVGTADYMAPEQAMDSRTVDIRSDLYGLGCTLYHALTGEQPFGGSNPVEKILKHQLDEPVPVETLRPEVPPALAAVVRKLMAKGPAERYQTPLEVAAALAPFCPGEQEENGMPRAAVAAPRPVITDVQPAEAPRGPIVVVPRAGASAAPPSPWVAWIILAAVILAYFGVGVLIRLLR
jgi:serine/threonine-protein kinase